jgi:hypothetical protein
LEAPLPRGPNSYPSIAIDVVGCKVTDVRDGLTTVAVIASKKEEGHKILRAKIVGKKPLNSLS